MVRLQTVMELGRFAVAVGAHPKWVQNAAAVLKLRMRYTVAQARHLGLVRELHSSFEMPLKAADEVAEKALSSGEQQEGTLTESRDGSAQLRIDVERYLSTFTARLGRARALGAEKQRGRRAQQARSPIEAARQQGVDIGLLMSSLSLPPAERLRRLDQNAAFLVEMRRHAR